MPTWPAPGRRRPYRCEPASCPARRREARWRQPHRRQSQQDRCFSEVTLPLRYRVRAYARGHRLGEHVDRHARAAKHRIPAHDLVYQPILGRRSGRADSLGQAPHSRRAAMKIAIVAHEPVACDGNTRLCRPLRRRRRYQLGRCRHEVEARARAGGKDMDAARRHQADQSVERRCCRLFRDGGPGLRLKRS
jgi:hypothetical protein